MADEVVLAAVREEHWGRVLTIETALAARGVLPPDRRCVEEVVVVCASSRGGSSVFHQQLAKSDRLWSLRGEVVPFEKLYAAAGLDPSAQGDSIADPSMIGEESLDRLWRALRIDLGVGHAPAGIGDLELAALELETRLMLQWPRSLCGDGEAARTSALGLLDGESDTTAAWRSLVGQLHRAGLLRAKYYDDPCLRELDDKRVCGPPAKWLVEEPPFINVLPRERPFARPGDTFRLLLKSSLAAYRLPLYLRLFPAARINVVHLLRNPAASTNGLIDGWLHWGFFSHDVSRYGESLDVAGYGEDRPWGSRWWNFDLPPGWQRFTGRPLPEVCAFQWASAHSSLLSALADAADEERVRACRVRFEDLVGDAEGRREAFERVGDFLGIRGLGTLGAEFPREQVMVTRPPAPGRWRARSTDVLEAIEGTGARDVAPLLGYDIAESDTWI